MATMGKYEETGWRACKWKTNLPRLFKLDRSQFLPRVFGRITDFCLRITVDTNLLFQFVRWSSYLQCRNNDWYNIGIWTMQYVLLRGRGEGCICFCGPRWYSLRSIIRWTPGVCCTRTGASGKPRCRWPSLPLLLHWPLLCSTSVASRTLHTMTHMLGENFENTGAMNPMVYIQKGTIYWFYFLCLFLFQSMAYATSGFWW